MRMPVIVVTGGVASGKTTVARVLAARGGAVVDCDRLAHEAYRDERLKRRLVAVFGTGVLTGSGGISRKRLGRIVFSDGRELDVLNGLVRPSVTRIIAREVRRLRERGRYIVLDAVAFFNYTFRFKVDLVVLTEASEQTRLARIIRRDGISRGEARRRIESQRALYGDWASADVAISTDCSPRKVKRIAASIRDGFLANHPGITRR